MIYPSLHHMFCLGCISPYVAVRLEMIVDRQKMVADGQKMAAFTWTEKLQHMDD